MSHALAQLGLQAFISDKMGYAQAEREIGGKRGREGVHSEIADRT